jgi:hypothetical protein
MADEAAMSRLYAGIHYRFDNDAGIRLGRSIARLALRSVLESERAAGAIGGSALDRH